MKFYDFGADPKSKTAATGNLGLTLNLWKTKHVNCDIFNPFHRSNQYYSSMLSWWSSTKFIILVPIINPRWLPQWLLVYHWTLCENMWTAFSWKLWYTSIKSSWCWCDQMMHLYLYDFFIYVLIQNTKWLHNYLSMLNKCAIWTLGRP